MKNFRLKTICAGILFCLCAVQAWAGPAVNTVLSLKQPDGTSISVRLVGDEHFSYRTTEDGYVIYMNTDGYYVYAERDNDGELVPSKVIARNADNRSAKDKAFLAAYTPFENFGQKAMQRAKAKREQLMLEAGSEGQQRVYPTTGTPRALVILVNFNDVKFSLGNPKKTFTRMLNEEGYSDNGAVGSARDYFKESSMGKFQPLFDVYGPFDLKQKESYYGDRLNDTVPDIRPEEMVVDACKIAFDNGVNFANYDGDGDGFVDNVFILYAGVNESDGGPEWTIWPHRGVLKDYTSVYNGKIVYDYACTSELYGRTSGDTSFLCGIGTFCHEFSHVLGLVDLYDTQSGQQATVGTHSIMADGTRLKEGKCPPAYSAHERFVVGWLKPTVLNVPADSIYLEPLVKSNTAYMVSVDASNMSALAPDPNDFYLIENRQKIGFDSYMPGHGMLLWRIQFNPTKWYSNTVNTANPNGVGIVAADGKYTDNEAGDFFPGTSDKHEYINTTDLKVMNMKEITEHDNGLITFKYMNGKNQPYINTSVSKLEIEKAANSSATFKVETGTATQWKIRMYPANANFTLSHTVGTEYTGPQTITVAAKREGSVNIETARIDIMDVDENLMTKHVSVAQSMNSIKQRCGWTTNYDLGVGKDSLWHGDLNIAQKPGLWGEVLGQNSYYQTEFAEHFINDGERTIDSISFYPYIATPSDPAKSKVTFRVYADNGGLPGKILGEKEVLLKDILITGNDNQDFVAFSVPVIVNGNFFVGYKVDYDKTPYDVFSCAFAGSSRRTLANTTAYLRGRTTWLSIDKFYPFEPGNEYISTMSITIGAHLNCTQGDNIKPIVKLETPFNVTDSAITLSATVERSGSKSITQRGFEYAKKGEEKTYRLVAGTEIGNYTMDMKNLVKNDTFVYRAYVITTNDTTYSQDEKTFVVGAIPDYLTVSPEASFLGARQGSVSLITVLTGLPWTVTIPDSITWLKLDTTRGMGMTNLQVTALAANQDTINPRIAPLTFEAGNLKYVLLVSQDAKIPVVLPAPITEQNEGNTRNAIKMAGTVDNDGYGEISEYGFYYSQTSKDFKINDPGTKRVAQKGKLLNKDKYVMIVDSLSGFYYYRAFLVNEAGEGVSEQGRSGTTKTDQPYLRLSTSLIDAPNAVADYSVKITSNMAWRVSTPDTWIATDKTIGWESDSLIISVLSENTAPEARMATITLSAGDITRIINVYQAGTSSDVEFSVTPAVINFKGTKDTVAYINIIAEGAWTVVAEQDWITPSTTSGTGIASVAVKVTQPTEARNGSIVVDNNGTPKSVIVNQAMVVAVRPSEQISITVAPNPVANMFVVKTSERIQEISLTDIHGRKMAINYNNGGKEASVDVQHLNSGIYIVYVKTVKGIVVEKIVKK